jgi:DNA-3-methyladenine glycosylase I
MRKREAFREAFHGFEAERVARFGNGERAALLANPGIVRNRLKIDAAITNARAVVALREQGGLDALFWSHAPERHKPPARLADLPASSPESVALAKALKRAGFVFVGPTTMYAAMQACGVVDDHVAGCHRARPQPPLVGT